MANNKFRRVVFLGAQRYPQYIVDSSLIPELSEPGQVLAKIRLATICGSDVHTIQGKRSSSIPSILGHEGVAEVVSDTVCHGNLHTGDRITFSAMDSCGQCERCAQGLNQKCLNIFKYGHCMLDARTGLNGCYASHIILHKGTHIIKIPDHVTDKMAAPINCALATMVNAVGSFDKRRSASMTALIQGAGLLGMYGCALLHDAGFKQVYCCDARKERLAMVPMFGGIPLQSGKEGEILKENGVDIMIEVCGTGDVIDTSLHLLKPGGTYVLVGSVHSDSKLTLCVENIIRKCLTIKGIYNYSNHHLDEAVEFISRTAGQYPYERLVGPAFSLNQFESALQEAARGRFWRVALDPSFAE